MNFCHILSKKTKKAEIRGEPNFRKGMRSALAQEGNRIPDWGGIISWIHVQRIRRYGYRFLPNRPD